MLKLEEGLRKCQKLLQEITRKIHSTDARGACMNTYENVHVINYVLLKITK